MMIHFVNKESAFLSFEFTSRWYFVSYYFNSHILYYYKLVKDILSLYGVPSRHGRLWLSTIPCALLCIYLYIFGFSSSQLNPFLYPFTQNRQLCYALFSYVLSNLSRKYHIIEALIPYHTLKRCQLSLSDFKYQGHFCFLFPQKLYSCSHVRSIVSTASLCRTSFLLLLIFSSVRRSSKFHWL